MRKLTWLCSTALAFLHAFVVSAFEPRDYAFLLTATAEPTQITISWPQKLAGQITVRRKLPSEQGWSAPIAQLPGDSTSFTDRNIQRGVAYEYEFQARLKFSPDDNSATAP